ncbi:MAG: hypothetical protein KBT01_10240 [Clostridiales bacterium]|nr:hypothetical protein [Candidatus Blautia equi]
MNKNRKKLIMDAILNWLKSMIGPIIILLVIVAGVLVIRFYKPAEVPTETIMVNSYAGEESSFVMENDKLKFELDAANTQFQVTNKTDDSVWYSNPQDAKNDPISKSMKLEQEKLQSTLLLTYSTKDGVDTLFNNYAYSMAEGIYNIEQGEDYIKVFYSIGEAEKEYIVPEVITAARMDEILDGLSKKESAEITDSFKKYDINNLKKRDNKEELLEKYPLLETEVIYVMRDTVKDYVKVKLQDTFAERGYTYEEYLESKGEAGGANDKPVFNINVIYRLEGNELVVEIPFDEMEYQSKYPLYYLSVLPYFGAGSMEDEGFLMVPEGGGALINFNNGKVAQNSYFANMYGWDHAISRESVVHETEMYFNAFGISRNDASFICILEDGAPYAGINADISGKKNGYNFVHPQYTLLHREAYEMGDRAAGTIYVFEQKLPAGEKIVQRYRFMDGGSYTDMANGYRAYLEEKYPENLQMNTDENAPLMVEIVGAIDKVKQILGVPVSRPLELTNFTEAKDIIGDLLGEGISNLSVKMSGWANGGVQQKLLKRVNVVSDLGGKKKLQELSDYAAANNVDFYLNGITNYAYDSNLLDGFFSVLDAARFVNREKAEIHPYSTVTFAAREGQDPHYLLKGELIPQMIDNLVKATDKYNTGVSFQDVGRELNSDYNRKDLYSRSHVLESQIEQLSALDAAGKKIMINMGNYYAIPYSNFVTNMDLSGSVYTIIDEAVPIYQMAVHGYINYTAESLNLTQNQEQILLESAEYGAGLAFTVMDETAFSLQNTLYTEYFGAEYDSWRDKILSTYNRYNEELGHTFSQKMVGHEKLNSDFTATTYEDGTVVYVNYSYDIQTTPEGQKVSPRDYLVVKN